MVARLLWVQKVVGSNPAAPIAGSNPAARLTVPSLEPPPEAAAVFFGHAAVELAGKVGGRPGWRRDRRPRLVAAIVVDETDAEERGPVQVGPVEIRLVRLRGARREAHCAPGTRSPPPRHFG